MIRDGLAVAVAVAGRGGTTRGGAGAVRGASLAASFGSGVVGLAICVVTVGLRSAVLAGAASGACEGGTGVGCINGLSPDRGLGLADSQG